MTLVNFESLGAFSPHATQKITYQELSFARFSESSQKILFGQVGKWLRGPAIRKLVRCLSVYNSSPADYKIGPPMLLTEAGFIHNASSYFGDDVKGQTTFLRGRLLEILYTKDRPLSIELLRLTTLFDRFLNFGERVVAPRRCLSEHPFEKMLRTAIENGHVEVVRALLDHNAPLSPHCLGAKTVFAAQKGHLEIVWM